MQTGCEAVAGAWEALFAVLPSLLGRLNQGLQTANVMYADRLRGGRRCYSVVPRADVIVRAALRHRGEHDAGM